MNFYDIERRCRFYRSINMIEKEKQLLRETLAHPNFTHWIWANQRLKELDPGFISVGDSIKPLVSIPESPIIKATKKIAFCFATYENMSQLDIWKKFFEQASPDQYTILTHAKFPRMVSQNFVRSHLIHEHLPSNWGGISLVRLMFKMFQYAFRDPSVYKVVNLSQSCIPLTNFQTVYDLLTSTDKGFLDWNNVKQAGHPPHVSRHPQIKNPNFISFDQFVMHQYEGECFSREMLNFFLQHDNTHLFDVMSIPDEHYVGNTLVHYKREDLVVRRHLHYCAYMGGQSKGGVSSISMDMIQDLLQKGKLFVRKLAPHAVIPNFL